MPRAKKPVKRKRSAIDGKYSTGEKAAEKLVNRIMRHLLPEAPTNAEADILDRLREPLLVALLAATTVTESAPKRIGKVGYAIRRTEKDSDGWLGGEDYAGWPMKVYRTKNGDPKTGDGGAAKALLVDGSGHSRARIVRVRLVEG